MKVLVEAQNGVSRAGIVPKHLLPTAKVELMELVSAFLLEKIGKPTRLGQNIGLISAHQGKVCRHFELG